MTEKELIKYRSLKRLIERKKEKITDICEKDVNMVIGTVKASSRNFPWIETHPLVRMNDPIEIDKRRKVCKVLEDEIRAIQNQIQEIELYIDSIKEPDIKEIFEMRVYDGMKWNDIAVEIDDDKDRTTYSKKFKNYIENSRNSPISQTSSI